MKDLIEGAQEAIRNANEWRQLATMEHPISGCYGKKKLPWPNYCMLMANLASDRAAFYLKQLRSLEDVND